jgi:hypothetical protein
MSSERFVLAVASMAGKNERLHGKQQRLKSQYNRMHQPDGIYDVQKQPFGRTQPLFNAVMDCRSGILYSL